jgi:hypothetical protein
LSRIHLPEDGLDRCEGGAGGARHVWVIEQIEKRLSRVLTCTGNLSIDMIL